MLLIMFLTFEILSVGIWQREQGAGEQITR